MNGTPLYRPTPSVTLLSGGRPTGPRVRGLRGGEMRGVILGCDYKSGADAIRRASQGNPWILASGTLNGFLGQDSFDSFDVSSIDTWMDPGFTLTPPDFGIAPPPLVLLPSSAGDVSYSPIGSTLTAPTFAPVAPVLSLLPSTPAPSQAGMITSGISALTAGAVNVAKAATGQPTMSTALVPRAGLYTVNPAAAPSWFSQATIVPGMPNYQVALLGAAALLLLGGVFSGSKAGYRR